MGHNGVNSPYLCKSMVVTVGGVRDNGAKRKQEIRLTCRKWKTHESMI